MQRTDGNLIGLFKLSGTFNLSGRGLVLVGEIIKGTIATGNYINLQTGDSEFACHINAVEFVDNLKANSTSIGLIVGLLNEEQAFNISNAIGQQCKVTR